MLPIAFAVWWFQVALAVAFCGYALSGPLTVLLRLRPSRASHAEDS
jgi:uncharacterized membrane protein YeiB